MVSTIKDVAKYAGVGLGTVSRVLNGGGSVNPAKREKVLEAIKALNYTPNKMASKLRKNETRNIALLVPIINHPFFAEFAYYVEDEADKFGYSVILVSSQQRVEKEADIIERIRRREVDGAVFVTHYAHNESELKGCPIVSLDRIFGAGIPYVTSDNYAATKKAVKYLLDNGCKKVGYVGSKPLVESEVSERERAYVDVMNETGNEKRIVNDVILHGGEQKVAEKFFDEFPDIDGVFVSGYTMAQLFLGTAKKRNKRIPEDIQVISYDGSFGQWGFGEPVTCIEQPVEKMARAVIDILVKKIHGEEVDTRVEFPTEFVLGNTTL
ncbi:MAG: LacI family DNA-binding transcriptional regulator [Clostridia bacterium]|nr:LacI family DNA-binding transcriptional regulator [Clostridia bacterium]